VVVIAVLGALWRLAHWPSWPVTLSLLLLPVAVLVAEDRFRNLGHALTRQTLVVRQGSLVRRRNMLKQDGIIGWNLRQSLFQRRAGVVTMEATTAGGRQRYAALDIPQELAVRLADQALPGLLTPFLVASAGA
jgi:putative membrane protein